MQKRYEPPGSLELEAEPHPSGFPSRTPGVWLAATMCLSAGVLPLIRGVRAAWQLLEQMPDTPMLGWLVFPWRTAILAILLGWGAVSLTRGRRVASSALGLSAVASLGSLAPLAARTSKWLEYLGWEKGLKFLLPDWLEWLAVATSCVAAYLYARRLRARGVLR